jgi:hypothetical protein
LGCVHAVIVKVCGQRCPQLRDCRLALGVRQRLADAIPAQPRDWTVVATGPQLKSVSANLKNRVWAGCGQSRMPPPRFARLLAYNRRPDGSVQKIWSQIGLEQVVGCANAERIYCNPNVFLPGPHHHGHPFGVDVAQQLKPGGVR